MPDVSHPNPCCAAELSSGFILLCTWCTSVHFIKLPSIPGIVKHTSSFPGIPVLVGLSNSFKYIPSFWLLGNFWSHNRANPILSSVVFVFTQMGRWVTLSWLVGYDNQPQPEWNFNTFFFFFFLHINHSQALCWYFRQNKHLTALFSRGHVHV